MFSSVAAFVLAAVTLGGVTAQATSGNITTGILGNATAIVDNPNGAQYIAQLPSNAFDTDLFPSGGNVQGAIQAVSMPSGQGVMFHVEFSGLPASGGPFLYHIHDQPVPADGNCTGTLAHLDPYQRGEEPACDASLPETCQVGDLSGKHGSINGTDFSTTFTDEFASTLTGIGAFFGNRSFVLHFANTTRITCANFTAVAMESSGCTGTTSTTSSTSTHTSVSTSSGAETATSTTTTSTTSTLPTGSNSTTATSLPTAVVTAAAYANTPVHVLAVGAALVFIL